MNGRRIAVGVLAALAGAVLTVPAAQASTTPQGPGLALHAEGRAVHEGAYLIGGHLLYCLDWGSALGNGKVSKGTAPAKLNAEAKARVSLIVNSWGQTADNRQAARVKLALDTIVAPFDPRLRRALSGMLAQVTATDRTVIAGMVDASRTHAPYVLRRVLTGAVPGQPGREVVTVTGSDGRPAVGRTVAFTVVGGTVISAGRVADSHGQAVVSFTASALSQTVGVTVTSPSSTAVWANSPTAGRQHMIGAGFTDAVKASDCVTLCPVSANVLIHAKCQDNGKHAVDVTFTVENVPGNYQGYVIIGGTRSDVAVTPGETRTVTGQLIDGERIEVGFDILGTDGQPLISRVLYRSAP